MVVINDDDEDDDDLTDNSQKLWSIYYEPSILVRALHGSPQSILK